MSLRTDVRGMEAAWNEVEDEMADDMLGPTLDYGDGSWSASAWLSVTPDGNTPDPIEAMGDTPVEALRNLAYDLRSLSKKSEKAADRG